MSGRLTGHVFRRTWKTKDGTEKTSWAFAIERGRVDGRRLTPITRGPFKTQKEASAALRDELTARENGTYIEPSRLTVGEWFTEVWVPSLAVAVENGTMRDSTRDLYERMVRLHISPKPFGALPIQALKTKDVTDLFTKLRTVGSPDGRGALGPGSLHNLRTVLHKGMKEAVAEEAVRRNVVALVPPPSRAGDEAEEPPHWAAGELARFLEYVDAVTAGAVVTEKRKSRKGTEYDYYRPTAPDPMLRAAFYLLAYTGMLRGEVCGLRWPQVNLKAGTAEVRGARVMVGGRAARSATKTRRGRRSLRLEPEVVQALHDWRRVQEQQRRRVGEKWEDDEGHVFTHEVAFTRPMRYGVPVRPDWLSKKFRRFARGAELPAMRMHGLRHSAVTNAAEQGVSSCDIADAVGDTPEVVERYYRLTFKRVQEAALAQVGGAIRNARAGGA